MNTFMKPRLYALSYSRLSSWETCPAQAKYKFLDKLREPDSPYAARGSTIHAQAEKYIDEGGQIPGTLVAVGHLLDSLKNDLTDIQCEQQIAFDKNWDIVDWFSPTVFMRVIYDVAGKQPDLNRIVVVDHKTGKVYPSHDDQLELYAMTAFHKWLEVDEVDVRIIYIDQKYGTPPKIYHRDQLPALHEKWDPRFSRAQADEIFAPTPNSKCKWCFYRASNGGPCQHG